MSADPRLAAFAATTFGFKFGVATGHNGELSLRLEQYEQRATDQSSSLPELQGLDLNPNLKATIVQLELAFGVLTMSLVRARPALRRCPLMRPSLDRAARARHCCSVFRRDGESLRGVARDG